MKPRKPVRECPRVQIIFFHDGVERPIQRPKDAEVQSSYYSGKKKCHTVKNNVLIDTESKVVFLTASYAGRIHDKRIADIAGYSPPLGSLLYQDTGFQGFTAPGIKILQPKKKPKGRELTVQEKETKNREISAIRIRVEHACGRKAFFFAISFSLNVKVVCRESGMHGLEGAGNP